ncbi:helix-turn-helix domain-containing protein [Paenibacillus methanolicus]|uniref:AraC-like DNA-binding protein n=1 Tax=Paenibacillus methanolicus TaxID=582686 RepID=A0A5S5CFS5_9BACL|nr:helix-turn-helix domain-containing protein [Paenibacillus methanolicus]TYP77538.1 AraC-like DNA-binding protein [Paenibacillus methanolicus]
MRSESAIQPAIDYVEANLGEPLELAQIAHAAAMSVPNLYRLFYAATGHPIKTYIRNRRINEAANRLRHTALPAIEIAFDCGFDTYQTFLRTFKRTTGLTPVQYRESANIYSFESFDAPGPSVTAGGREEALDRCSDVRVMHLPPMQGLGYMHAADAEEGIEEAAMARFRALLTGAGVDIAQVRLFGWNVDLPDEAMTSRCGYRLVAVHEQAQLAAQGDLRPASLPEGMHAAAWAPSGPGDAITDAWNRLLGEWLPRSAFELRSGIFLEEYQQFGGRIARMKLYLPVSRGREAVSIMIEERPPVRGIGFRAEGEQCEAHADEAAVRWLTERIPRPARRPRLYMGSGSSPDGKPYCQLVLAFDGVIEPGGGGDETELEGGLFACLRARVHGPMGGVKESVLRFLAGSPEYATDPGRCGYVYYEPDSAAAPAPRPMDVRQPFSAIAVCCVPARRRLKEEGKT